MNWGRLTFGNPEVTHAAIAMCLLVSGYLAVVPLQKDDQLLEGILLVDTIHQVAMQEEISDWIVSDGDTLQTGQIIGYTLSKQHRQALEAMVDIGTSDQALAIDHMRDLLATGILGAGPAKSWIGRHLIQSLDLSTNRNKQGRQNQLQELKSALTDVEDELGVLRMRRLNQAGSEHAEADLAEMNALEKEQMKLHRQINAEIQRSERTAPHFEKQSRWMLNVPLDSLIHIAKSELQYAAVVASASGRLTRQETETAGDQYWIESIGTGFATLELAPGSAFDPSENESISMALSEDSVSVEKRVLNGRIVSVQHHNDKIRVKLNLIDNKDISPLATATEVRIQLDEVKQMTIFGLLTSREL